MQTFFKPWPWETIQNFDKLKIKAFKIRLFKMGTLSYDSKHNRLGEESHLNEDKQQKIKVTE